MCSVCTMCRSLLIFYFRVSLKNKTLLNYAEESKGEIQGELKIQRNLLAIHGS